MLPHVYHPKEDIVLTLQEIASSKIVVLLVGEFAGRSAGAALRLDHDEVSTQHAEFRYHAVDGAKRGGEDGHSDAQSNWHVRDRSRNGTWVNDHQCLNDDSKVVVGDVLVFGSVSAGKWKVIAAETPAHSAPELTIARPRWPLDALVKLVFRVVDADHVHLELVTANCRTSLGDRSSWRPLCRLAEALLRDAEAGKEEVDQGWVITDDLKKEFPHLDAQITRAKPLLTKAGVADADLLIRVNQGRTELDSRGKRLKIPGARRLTLRANQVEIIR